MKSKILSLTLLAALASAGWAVPAAAAPATAPYSAANHVAADPAEQVRTWARLFRSSDVPGLVQSMVPPSKWEEAKLLYELKQLDPIDKTDRIAFAEQVERVTATDAVDRLMLEIEPKLEEVRPQAAGALLMAFGAMQMAVSSPESDLTDDQRAALQSALPGIQTWASTTDFLSSDTMRQALTLLTDAARRTAITDLDQLRGLPLETLLGHAGPLLVAGKQAVRLYGIDLDAVVDSLQVEVIELNGDSARVRSTITLFDTPISAEHDMVLVEGRWYGKEAARPWNMGHEFATRD